MSLQSIRQFLDSIASSSSYARGSQWCDINKGIIENQPTRKIRLINSDEFKIMAPGTKIGVIFKSNYVSLSDINLEPFLEMTFEGFITEATGLVLASFSFPKKGLLYTRIENLDIMKFIIDC
jgi:hypothetical protein